MADMQLVLSIFPDEAAADSAVESLKSGTATATTIKLGAIGVLVLDEKGQIKAHKLGRGAVARVRASVSSWRGHRPTDPARRPVGGGVIGHFHHPGLGLDKGTRDRIIAELSGGKAAVGVMTLPQQAQVISETLADLGGTIRGSRRLGRGARCRRDRGSGRRGRAREHGPGEGMKRPAGITVIAVLSFAAGAIYLLQGIQILGFVVFGPGHVFTIVSLTGWMTLSPASSGWRSAAPCVAPAVGWLFGIVVAGFSLIEAFFGNLNGWQFGDMFGAMIVPLVVIFYLETDKVKAAFGLEG